jgi:hypothetical protein
VVRVLSDIQHPLVLYPGDIHGQFSDLIRIFTEVCGLPGKNSTKFLFLG